MVGFVSKPPVDGDLSEPPKLRDSVDPPDLSSPKINDVSFADSFLDFDSIEDWFKDNPTTTAGLDSIDIDKFDFGDFEMAGDGDGAVLGNPERFSSVTDSDLGMILGENPATEPKVEAEAEAELSSSIEKGLGKVTSCDFVEVKTEMVSNNGEDNVNTSFPGVETAGCSSIEKDLEKVSLAGEIGSCGLGELKTEMVCNKDEDTANASIPGMETTGCSSLSEASSSESSEESESASSSSSKESDSDDDEDEEVKKDVILETELEEGEIMEAGGRKMVSVNDDGEEDDDEDADNMVTWSDVDEDEEGGGATKPIRSKNELAELPPVPPVDVALQPNHQMLPVGVVLSILGPKVIVEGVENHNPLSEGSILWITEKRSPLGLIDEIFGPVKNPYYVVRYNSESEVPSGLQDGSLISFVPEFANHVLDDKNLYKKGYDASGDNDEELSEEAEFSDDEKEAEYKKMLKMSKRGLNDQNLGNAKNNKKKGKNRDGQWKNNKPAGQQLIMDKSHPPPDQNQPKLPPHDLANVSSSFSVGQGLASGTGMIPSFPQNAQAGGFPPNPNGPWNNGMQYQQPQGIPFQNGFPAQALPLLLQNLIQNAYQMPMPNGMPFPQQFDPSQRPPLPCPPGGQPSFFPGSVCAPWPGFVGQNNFNQTPFGMGLQGQQLPQPTNAGQVMIPNETQMEQNRNVQQPAVGPGNFEAPQQFNQGASYARGRGRRQFQRGGARFAGGRGRGRGRQQQPR